MDQLNEIAFTQSFTLRMDQVAKIVDLAQRKGKSKSEIVRMAIDLLYQAEEQKEVEAVEASDDKNN